MKKEIIILIMALLIIAPVIQDVSASKTVFITSDNIIDHDQDVRLLNSLKQYIEEISGGELQVIVDNQAPGAGEGWRSINVTSDVSVDIAASDAGNYYQLASATVNTDKQIVFVNIGNYDLDNHTNFLRRAWDDNYSNESLAGMHDPGTFLKNAGIYYIQPTKEFPDNVEDGVLSKYDENMNRQMAKEIVDIVNGYGNYSKVLSDELIVTNKLSPQGMADASKMLIASGDKEMKGPYGSYSTPQLLYQTSAYLNGDGIDIPKEYDGPENPLGISLLTKDTYSIYDYFNEPEAFSDDSKEPEITTVVVSTHTRKKKTKREDKLEGLPARIYDHTIDPEKLKELFPNGYKELPCEIYKRLAIIPQTFLVDEHHVHVYASKNNDGTMVKAERPRDLFRNSIATPSLVATILTGKYLNHLPLDRQSRCLKDNGIQLETNTLANWMMNASDDYLRIIYDRLHKDLYSSHLVHADETPFEVIKDGRSAGSKSYMWVYRNGACDTEHPVVIYDYQPTRKADNPSEFLKGYSGVVLTDGYQVYHTLERKRDDLRIAGCWIHYSRSIVIPEERQRAS